MDKRLTLNEKQKKLVKKLEKLIKEMQDEKLICINYLGKGEYGYNRYRDFNELLFLNGTDVSNITVNYNEDLRDDGEDFVVPEYDEMTKLKNFVYTDFEDDDNMLWFNCEMNEKEED